MSRIFLLLVCLSCLATGCSELTNTGQSPRETPPEKLTQEELREKLEQFQDTFEAIVRRACDDIVQRDNSRRFKRLTLVWQMQIIPMSRNALDQDNPAEALLDLAFLCLRQQLYLESGEGKEIFGPYQEIARRAAAEANEDLGRIASRVLTPQQQEDARTRIRKFAEEYPLRGDFSGRDVRLAREQKGDTVLQGIVAIPMAPFRWLGGVDHTAQAIKGFTVVAARMTDVIEGLATDTRLQAQLLLLEIDDMESTRSGLESLAKVGESSKRLAAAAESLPEDLRKELLLVFDDLDARQDHLRGALNDTRDTAESIDMAAQSLASAADAIARMIASFSPPEPLNHNSKSELFKSEAPQGPADTPKTDAIGSGIAASVEKPAHPAAKQSRPFDINDYTLLGDSIGAAARELRALATEIDTVAQSKPFAERLNEMDARVNRMLAESELRAAAATDHAFWRLVQLAVLMFVLATAYFWIGRRFRLSERAST